jgi:Fic family protein
MSWNWEKKNWPNFIYDANAIEALESKFLKNSGILAGSLMHIREKEQQDLVIDIISTEALKTSEIEGEYLDRSSVVSSIQKNFGLSTKNNKAKPAETGIADLMYDLYEAYPEPISDETLYNWHSLVMRGNEQLDDIGRYRRQEAPMQILSGPIGREKIHFEAPPSKIIKKEMKRFIKWFNESASLPALTRAGIAHLYFVSIHPFEDGNGRIARALCEKALAQNLKAPTLSTLSKTIEDNKKAYYKALELNNKNLDITDWLLYFAKTSIDAQTYSQSLISFLIEKTKLYDEIRGKINSRQDKVLSRMFKEGPKGFEGGLSAENYIRITDTSRATATRDLQDLVEKKALLKKGERKHTRYYLNINS